MQNLIVLGLVPGTHIQITFGLWLICGIIAAILASLLLLRPLHWARNWLVAIGWSILSRRDQSA